MDINLIPPHKLAYNDLIPGRLYQKEGNDRAPLYICVQTFDGACHLASLRNGMVMGDTERAIRLVRMADRTDFYTLTTRSRHA